MNNNNKPTTTSTSSPALSLKNYNSSPNVNVESRIKYSTIEMGLLLEDSNGITTTTNNNNINNMNSITSSSNTSFDSSIDEVDDNSFIKGPWTAEVTQQFIF